MPLQVAQFHISLTYPNTNSLSTWNTLSIVIGMGRSVRLLMFPLTCQSGNAKKKVKSERALKEGGFGGVN